MTLQNGAWKEGRTKVALKYPYSPSLVEESKQLGTSRYDRDRKLRTYSERDLPNIVAFCHKHNLPLEEGLEDLAKEQASKPDIEMYKGGIRLYRGPGASLPDDILQSDSGSWTLIPGAEAQKVVSWARKVGKKIAPEVKEYARSQFRREVENHSLGTALSAAPVQIAGLISQPIPEQWVPVHVALKSRRFILADEQGLGKTIQSLMVARISGDQSERLVIVCPDRLADTWTEEMEKHFAQGMFTPQIAMGKKPSGINEDTDVLVIGWSILGDWVDTLIAWNPDMVVADEGHYAKSGKVVTRKEEVTDVDATGKLVNKQVTKKVGGSRRSDAIIHLLASLPDDGKAMILTGTPIPNRPSELLPLLQALNVDGYFGGPQNFKMRYCGPQQKYIGAGRGIRGSGYVWDFSGASNLHELNARMLASGHYIRRTKEHLVVADRLPCKVVDGVEFYTRGKTRSPLMLEGDPATMEEYVAMAYELEEEFLAHARQYARRYGLRLDHPKVIQAIERQGRKQKSRLFELRRLAGVAAIPETIKVAQALVDQQEKVLIVAHHREVVDAYCEAFEGSTKIKGGMTPKQIKSNKAKFNSEGFESPVMVLAIEAAKTGHTLCYQPDKKCAHVLNAEQSWNPGDERQVQDRVWRLGQDREVTIRNLIVRNTVSQDIYDGRLSKERVIDAAVDNLRSDFEVDESTGASKLAVSLVKDSLK